LDLLTHLVDKSLVNTQEMENGETRYDMLQTMREYAREKLEEAGETIDTQTRHLDWFLELAEEAEPKLSGPEQLLWLNHLETEHDNLRKAIHSAQCFKCHERGLRLTSALHRFWLYRNYLTEGRNWLEATLDSSESAPKSMRAKALNALGILTSTLGVYDIAKRALETCIILRRELGDLAGMAAALNNLAMTNSEQGDHERARTIYEECLHLYRHLGDNTKVAIVLMNLGTLAEARDAFADAQALLEESLAMQQMGAGDPWLIAVTTYNLGDTLLKRSDYVRAQQWLSDSLRMMHELGDSRMVAYSLFSLGLAATGQGDWERGARLLAAASAARKAIGVPLSPKQQELHDREIDALRGVLGNDLLLALFAEGEKLSPTQAEALVGTRT
jgi:non-specific serine/threonine protein kinase